MRRDNKSDIIKAATLMINRDLSIRQISKKMHIPITTVYRHLKFHLANYDDEMHSEVKDIMLSHRYNRSLQKSWKKST